MEVNTLVIILATVFTLLVLLVALLIISASQRNRAQLLMHLKTMELTRQKEISENTLRTQEKERQHIGLEIHDEMGPSFAAIRFNMDRIRNKLEKDKLDGIEDLLRQSSKDLQSVILQFTNISHLLYPVALIRFGLKRALEELILRANNAPDMKFNLQNDLLTVKKDVVNISLYRICQEFTTNAIKHSRATMVHISLHENEGSIRLSYNDNGAGFELKKDYKGLGLESIKGRVQAISGTMELNSTPNKGVDILIDIPND